MARGTDSTPMKISPSLMLLKQKEPYMPSASLLHELNAIINFYHIYFPSLYSLGGEIEKVHMQVLIPHMHSMLSYRIPGIPAQYNANTL